MENSNWISGPAGQMKSLLTRPLGPLGDDGFILYLEPVAKSPLDDLGLVLGRARSDRLIDMCCQFRSQPTGYCRGCHHSWDTSGVYSPSCITSESELVRPKGELLSMTMIFKCMTRGIPCQERRWRQAIR